YNNLMQQTLGGWEFNSIVSLAEGSSLSIFTNGGVSGNTVTPAGGTAESSTLSALVGTGYIGNQRPLLVAGTSCNTGRNGEQILNVSHFTLNGYAIGTFPANLAPRGSCFGAPNTNVDSQLAKNWMIKEKYRIKFSMDFFNLFNHANFNSNNLEGSAFNPTGGVYCGGATATSGAPCSPTNNIISNGTTPTAASPAGFGQAGAVHPGRELQYTLRFSF
ncbi:MAG: hypothetical protein WA826_14625, partial [Silvibacterium sp.]